MKLNKTDLQQKELWCKKGYELPQYDREQIKKNTLEAPTWIHFGAGNIFRGFPAAVQQTLLNKNIYDKGIIVAEGYDYEIIDAAYKPYDNLSLLVVLKANGTIEKKVIGSVVHSLTADSQNSHDWNELIQIFENPSLQMVSFTITEKGYSVTNSSGAFFDDVKSDFENGPAAPKNIIGKVAALCYRRYLKGQFPLALVSMDNCSHNGEKLYAAAKVFAEKWVENKLVDAGFADYINNPEKVSFPWSMIDKITPRPDSNVQKMLDEDGFEDTNLIHTQKNTYTAPFVNAEEAQYLVIEDLFPNGRPPLDQAGIIFTDRETVNKVEKMKVCTCLNPLHTALAIFGCLLSYRTIFEEMNDETLKALVQTIGYKEGMPVVVDPKIINPADFLNEVVNVRLPNPFMPDTPQRIATDTSQKLPIRFGETIKAYQKREDLNVQDLNLIPLVFAGWCRYLMGINDDGQPFEISADPLLAQVQPCVADIKLGDKGPFAEKLKPILSNEKIFGVDLYATGLAEKVVTCFTKFVAGKGAVKATLKEYIK